MKTTYNNTKKSLLTVCALAIASASTLAAVEVVFRQGADIPALEIVNYSGTQDNALFGGGSANLNYGGALSLGLGKTAASGNPIEARSILKFDLSSLSGIAASIDSVTLTMTLASNFTLPSGSMEFNLYQIQDANAGWVEGTQNGAAAAAGVSTWNNLAHPSTGWAGSPGLSTAGTDYIATAIDGPKIINSPAGVGTTFTWTLPVSLIESWIEGTNAGLLFSVTDYENLQINDYVRFSSSEADTANRRPTLTINYTPIPEARGAALLLASAVIGVVLLRRKLFPKSS